MEIKSPRQKHLFPSNTQAESTLDAHLAVKTYFLYVDGASRGNPGKAGIGMVGFCVDFNTKTILLDDHTPILRHGFFIGHSTNNLCEYAALVCGLFLLLQKIEKGPIGPKLAKHCVDGCEAKSCGKNLEAEVCYKPILEIYSDSQLMVNQLNGSYKTRDIEIKVAKSIIDKLLENFHWEITHILRDKNTQADKLANLGIDKKVPLPSDLKSFLEKNKLLELFCE